MSNIQTRAAAVRNLAQVIRENPLARDAIADGFELIADAMEPCEDCGNPSLADLSGLPGADAEQTSQDA